LGLVEQTNDAGVGFIALAGFADNVGINLKNARNMAFFDLLPRRSKGLSFANSEILSQPQAIDLARRFEEREEQCHD